MQQGLTHSVINDDNGQPHCFVIGNEEQLLARTYGVHPEHERFAAMAVAAPKMFAALKALKTANGAKNFDGWHESFNDAIALANEAILEAGGVA